MQQVLGVGVNRYNVEFTFVTALVSLSDEYRLANKIAVELKPFGGQVL
jgi:hypothetical protein